MIHPNTSPSISNGRRSPHLPRPFLRSCSPCYDDGRLSVLSFVTDDLAPSGAFWLYAIFILLVNLYADLALFFRRVCFPTPRDWSCLQSMLRHRAFISRHTDLEMHSALYRSLRLSVNQSNQPSLRLSIRPSVRQLA